jgi:hypothetical protein
MLDHVKIILNHPNKYTRNWDPRAQVTCSRTHSGGPQYSDPELAHSLLNLTWRTSLYAHERVCTHAHVSQTTASLTLLQAIHGENKRCLSVRSCHERIWASDTYLLQVRHSSHCFLCSGSQLHRLWLLVLENDDHRIRQWVCSASGENTSKTLICEGALPLCVFTISTSPASTAMHQCALEKENDTSLVSGIPKT